MGTPHRIPSKENTITAPLFLVPRAEGISTEQVPSPRPRLRVFAAAAVLLGIYLTLPLTIGPLILGLPSIFGAILDQHLFGRASMGLALLLGSIILVLSAVAALAAEGKSWWRWIALASVAGLLVGGILSLKLSIASIYAGQLGGL